MERSPESGSRVVRDIRLAPHQLTERNTPQADLFVIAHVGIPRVEVSTWQLEITGLVPSPQTLTFDDILSLPKRCVEAFHQCAGFPRRADVPTRRVANVVWGGADLYDIMKAIGISPGARFLWAYGLDKGAYEDFPSADYVKDMPLKRLAEGGVLLAYEVNGEPLTPAHGYPVRLVIPGYYGTNAVKWLRRLELSADRPSGPFTTALYNDPVPWPAGRDTRATLPVWQAGPEAIIVTPRNGAVIARSAAKISGWAWGSSAVDRVELSVDGGSTWFLTSLEVRNQWSWQRFEAEWSPVAGGSFAITARATDRSGTSQPMNCSRNAVHTVRIKVSA